MFSCASIYCFRIKSSFAFSSQFEPIIRAHPIRMTFIYRYSTVLRYLFLLGLCPLDINTTTGLIESTRFTRFYNSILFLTIVSIVSVLMYIRISITFSLPNVTIPILGSTIQLLIIQTTYVAVIVQSLRTATAHSTFLNGIVAVDQQITEHLGSEITRATLERSSLFNWNMIETFGLAVTFSLAMVYANTLVSDPSSYSSSLSTHFLLLCLVDLMMVSMFSIMQHVRFCARLLCVRHRLLNDRLIWLDGMECADEKMRKSNYVNVFNLLDDVWKLREQFKCIFQFELLMNTMFDLVVVILTCFLVWCMVIKWHGAVGFKLIVTLFGTLFVLPVCKCLMMVSAVAQFGAQVDRTREIIGRTTSASDRRHIDREFIVMV